MNEHFELLTKSTDMFENRVSKNFKSYANANE